MRMQEQILSPSMQDRQEADIGTQVFGVAGHRQQRFRGGTEQQIVDELLVLPGDAG
jgi:hypothetical protein